MIEKAMREFLRVAVVVVAVLAAYFGYVYWSRPTAYLGAVRDAQLVIGLLDDYHTEKGTYPVLPGVEVPIAKLIEALRTSGVTFRSRIRSRDFDENARYGSETGEGYSLLYHLNRFGPQPLVCLVEMNNRGSQWWTQPSPCPG